MNFTEVRRCVWGSRTHVLPYTEILTHKVNTHLVLVSCMGETICKKLWVLLTPVGIDLIAERWSKFFCEEGSSVT